MPTPPGPRPVIHGTGIRVVLIHGLLDRAASFLGVLERLRGIQSITYDRRGCGNSTSLGPPADGLRTHVADLISILGDEPAVLVGHSFGGQVAMSAASVRPDQAIAVGVFETALPWEPWWPARHRRMIFADSPAVSRSTGRGDTSRVRSLQREIELTTRQRDLESIRDSAYDPAALEPPVTVGWGEESHPDAVAGYCEYVKRIGVQAYPIAGAGHNAHRSHPAEFAHFVQGVVNTRADSYSQGL